MDQPTKPIAKFFDKGVSGAVFCKNVQNGEGEDFVVYDTVIEARYQNKAGVYQSTSYFSAAQLPIVAQIAQFASEAISQHKTGQDNETHIPAASL